MELGAWNEPGGQAGCGRWPWLGVALVWAALAGLASFDPFPTVVPTWLGVATFTGLFAVYAFGCHWLRAGRVREGVLAVVVSVGWLWMSVLWAAGLAGRAHWFLLEPVLLAVVVVIPVATVRRHGRVPWVVGSAVIGLLVLSGLVGSTDAVVRARVVVAESEMNRLASKAIAQGADSDEPGSKGREPSCDWDRTTRVGPFTAEGCPQVREGRQGPEVWYSSATGGNGYGVTNRGIFFARGGPRSSDDPEMLSDGVCVNHLAGAWWEWYAPRSEEPCPRGFHRFPT